MKRIASLLPLVLAITVLSLSVAIPVGAELVPDSYTGTLSPGESVSIVKTVTGMPELPNTADVLFAFDVSGSMGPILDEAKSKAEIIMSQLVLDTGIDINFGVASYTDYPFDYTGQDNCGYTSDDPYGNEPFPPPFAPSEDYPFALNQPITGTPSAVASAIDALVLGQGGDEPESHARAFYESYADLAGDPDPAGTAGGLASRCCEADRRQLQQ